MRSREAGRSRVLPCSARACFPSLSQVFLGTFHSICARLLRRHGDALPAVVPGLDGRFTIFDREDSRRLLTEIIKEKGVATKEVRVSILWGPDNRAGGRAYGDGCGDDGCGDDGRGDGGEKFIPGFHMGVRSYGTGRGCNSWTSCGDKCPPRVSVVGDG